MTVKIIFAIGFGICSVQLSAKNLSPSFTAAICKVHVGPLHTSSYKIVAANPTVLCTCAYARQHQNVILCTHTTTHAIPKEAGD